MTGRTNAGGGVQLPALTNPAAAGNIQSGYQAINGEGEVVTGTYVPPPSFTQVSGTVECSSFSGESIDLYCVSGNELSEISCPNGSSKNFEVNKQSIIFVIYKRSRLAGSLITGGLTQLASVSSRNGNNLYAVYQVTGDSVSIHD